MEDDGFAAAMPPGVGAGRDSPPRDCTGCRLCVELPHEPLDGPDREGSVLLEPLEEDEPLDEPEEPEEPDEPDDEPLVVRGTA